MTDAGLGKNPWDGAAGGADTAAKPFFEKTPQPAERPHPDGVTLSFRGGEHYDASLLVLRAPTISAMDRMLDDESDELTALLNRMARIQAFNTELCDKDRPKAVKGRPVFTGGKVVQEPPNPEHKGVVSCPHGRTYVAKPTWEGYFCNSEGADKCRPSFRNRKTGEFELARN